jgi:hypothetical protein
MTARPEEPGIRAALPETFQDPAVPMIALPTAFTSQRVNTGASIPDDGSAADVAEIKGPGCIRHIWILHGNEMTLEILVDDAEEPQVLAPLKSFFGVMQDRDPYYVDCCAYTVLPNPAAAAKDPAIPGDPGYNLYLPIPFSTSCRIRVHGPKGKGIGVMIDWHKYDEGAPLTPYRLHAAHRRHMTAPERGSSIEMANETGQGFIAGFVTGYVQKNHADMVFHTGGTTILLDGETNPHAIRGCNVEDDYGFTWGFNNHQTRWIGCPQHDNRGRCDQDGVFYRFFGPDPIAFQSSMSFRAGCRGDDMETVVYYYKIAGTRAPEVVTPSQWQVTGLFPGADDWETFQKPEFVERLPPGPWPEELRHGGNALPVSALSSDHAWIDLQNLFFARQHTATPVTATDQSAYARASIESESDRKATLRLAVDDWCRVWFNGKHVADLRHEGGLETAEIPVTLRQGTNELLLKTNNTTMPPNNRLWALSCVVEA